MPEAIQEGEYIYCIVGTGEARNFGPIGIGDRGDPVTTVAYRDLSAVVSRVPLGKYVVSKETMIAHQKVVEMVMKDHTVLPVRYYTVALNAEEIRSLLRTRYAEFKKLLRELDNKVELGLKVLWRNMEVILNEIGQENEEIKRLRQELHHVPSEPSAHRSSAIAEAIRGALEARKAQERETILAPLKRLSLDLRLNQTYGDEMVVNAAFLVDRIREREFDLQVDALAEKHHNRVTLNYVGPVPPYNFVNIVIK